MVIENSSAGLVMLGAEVTVTVTREDQHQSVLARYPVAAGQQRNVAVELAWCTIVSGKYRGQPAVEVRLDGHRVGELTYAMSRRYGPLISQVASRGGRPGCEATIQLGTKGLEIVLRLPRHATGVVPMPAPHVPPQAPSWPSAGHAAPPAGPVFPSSVPPRRSGRSRRPLWVAAAVVGVLFVGALTNNDDESSPSAIPAADRAATTTAAALPTTTTAVTTAAPTTPPAAAVTPIPAPKPLPPPPPPQPTKASPKPAAPPPPPPPPPPKPAPKPAPQCHPNYSGCVPVASDVDCAGGSGNGPAYVSGPIRVIGSDVYGLDHDKDGIACE